MKIKARRPEKRALSLSSLSFDEAVTDIMKIKPEPKPAKKKMRASKRSKRGAQ